MARKRYNEEDILRLLREIEVHLHGGVQPPNYVPFFNRVSGTGGLMFRAW